MAHNLNMRKIKNDIIKQRLNYEIDNSSLKKKEIAGLVGISQSTLSDYKHSKKMPSLETFANICEVLNLDANYVLGIRDFESE